VREQPGKGRRRRDPQDAEGIATGEVGAEGLERTGKVIQECRAKSVDLSLSVPDGVLVGPGQYLHRRSEVAVAGHAAVILTISAHEIGQYLRVAGIGLRSRDVMTIAVSRGRHGVNGEDGVTGRHQRGHDQSSVFLNTHDDFRDIVVVRASRHQLVQFTDAR
jgi:hypothetical protein